MSGGASVERQQVTLLSIGDLARETGMTASTLRAWETRYDFPRPGRPNGGHRRYSSRDVDAILEVRRRRDAGVRLDVAITQVRAEMSSAARLSVFAEVARAHPAQLHQVLTKPSLLAISRAIEDEVTATSLRGHLFAGFQTDEHYAPSRARWGELARMAASTHVFAQSDENAGAGCQEGGEHDPVLVTLPADAPMVREWLVVCDAPDLSVAMMGFDRPGQTDVSQRDRLFEVMWTVDPDVVRDAARRCAETASAAGSVRATELLAGPLATPPRSDRARTLSVERLVHRIIRYLEDNHRRS